MTEGVRLVSRKAWRSRVCLIQSKTFVSNYNSSIRTCRDSMYENIPH